MNPNIKAFRNVLVCAYSGLAYELYSFTIFNLYSLCMYADAYSLQYASYRCENCSAITIADISIHTTVI